MKTYISIMTLLTLVSCSTTNNLTTEQIIGKYLWNGVYDVGSSIELKSDKTFEYKWHTGLIGGITFGNWKKEGNIIILNSDLERPQDGTEDFEIVKTVSKNTDSLSIRVISPKNESVPFATCVLKTDTNTLAEASTDFQGETKMPRLKADSLIISFLGYKTIRHQLDSSKSHYEFKMKEENEYYEYFTDETWTLRSGRLYDPSIKKNKYVKKNYYERIK